MQRTLISIFIAVALTPLNSTAASAYLCNTNKSNAYIQNIVDDEFQTENYKVDGIFSHSAIKAVRSTGAIGILVAEYLNFLNENSYTDANTARPHVYLKREDWGEGGNLVINLAVHKLMAVKVTLGNAVAYRESLQDLTDAIESVCTPEVEDYALNLLHAELATTLPHIAEENRRNVLEHLRYMLLRIPEERAQRKYIAILADTKSAIATEISYWHNEHGGPTCEKFLDSSECISKLEAFIRREMPSYDLDRYIVHMICDLTVVSDGVLYAFRVCPPI